MIRLTNVSKRFSRPGADAQALCAVDLVIQRGEFIAVTGPPAAGKTTLLNIIGLIDTPSSGRVDFDGSDLGACSEADLTELRKRHVGFVFQNFGLVEDLTVFANVELPLRYRRLSRHRRRVATRELLEIVDLQARADAYPAELSAGEQRRVATARAVVHDPTLILADEPTGDIDGESAACILEMLGTMHGTGTTVLMATHSHGCAAQAERVIELHDGRVLAGQEGGH